MRSEPKRSDLVRLTMVMFDRLQILHWHQARRAIALLTALVVIVAAVGIPLPQYRQKDTSRPFPCMHHACGCLTAASCWSGCCCLTDEQKLAWAEEHHVAVPAEFALASSQTDHGTRVKAGSCCRADGCDAPVEPKEDTTATWQVVRIESLRKCQGLASLWMILGQALPPAESETFQIDRAAVARAMPPGAPPAISPSYDPATPPPRAVL